MLFATRPDETQRQPPIVCLHFQKAVHALSENSTFSRDLARILPASTDHKEVHAVALEVLHVVIVAGEIYIHFMFLQKWQQFLDQPGGVAVIPVRVDWMVSIDYLPSSRRILLQLRIQPRALVNGPRFPEQPIQPAGCTFVRIEREKPDRPRTERVIAG